MKYEVIKSCEGFYILNLYRADGTVADYRFRRKAELNRWLKLADIR